jgi:transcriptional regulator with XRE-family HTH domain
MVLIHEKITALLEQRRLKKRDLARALGVSPQTATDICKGRSAVTLPHLRNLVAFFEANADYWLDDERRLPDELDAPRLRRRFEALARFGLTRVGDPERLLTRVRAFVHQHRREFAAAFPDLTPEERAVIGLVDAGTGLGDQLGTDQLGKGQLGKDQLGKGQLGTGQLGT